MTDDPTPAVPTNAPTDAPPGLLARIANRFRRAPDVRRGEVVGPDAHARHSILPWSRQNQAIQSMARGFDTLTDLMAGIRDNLQAQQARQDELLDHLRHLPETLRQIPESARGQADALRAIGRQLEGQQEHQERLGDILDTLNKGGAAQRESIDDLQKRLERMRETDAQVAENLGGVGRAMGDLGRSSSASTAVLERMQAAMDRRSDEMEKALARQASRFAWLMAVTILLCLLALAAAGAVAYLLLNEGRIG